MLHYCFGMWNMEQGLKNLTHPVCNARQPRSVIRHFQGPDIQRFVVGERNLPSDPELVATQIFYVHVLVNISGFKFISLFGTFDLRNKLE